MNFYITAAGRRAKSKALAKSVATVEKAEAARMMSDSDDDLPAFDKVNSSFSTGDLIWVKFRQYPFWPALVSCRFFALSYLVKSDGG